MALVTPTITSVGDGRDNVLKVTWVLTTADHTGVALGVDLVQHTDLCWHATGTWGSATAAIEGSNTDTSALYGAMTNAAGGSAITWTADGAPKQSVERPLFIRPRLSAVGVGASVTVVLCARRNRRLA